MSTEKLGIILLAGCSILAACDSHIIRQQMRRHYEDHYRRHNILLDRLNGLEMEVERIGREGR